MADPPGLHVTKDSLSVLTHIAVLENGKLPLPPFTDSIIIEVGTSDRDTADKEILPAYPNASLISVEPLIDKYAKALVRHPMAMHKFDTFQPLSQHHPRGIVLPLAIGPHEGIQEFKVSGNSGCASLLEVNNDTKWGAWCKDIRERRHVVTVTLARLLSWISLPSVAFLKLDTQGLDLDVVRSGGALLGMVERISMEVVADDCNHLYAGQPNCTTIVSTMSQLGFEAAAPVPCSPRFPRGSPNSLCELEILFLRRNPARTAEREPVVPEPFWFFHSQSLNGCNESLSEKPTGLRWRLKHRSPRCVDANSSWCSTRPKAAQIESPQLIAKLNDSIQRWRSPRRRAEIVTILPEERDAWLGHVKIIRGNEHVRFRSSAHEMDEWMMVDDSELVVRRKELHQGLVHGVLWDCEQQPRTYFLHSARRAMGYQNHTFGHAYACCDRWFRHSAQRRFSRHKGAERLLTAVAAAAADAAANGQGDTGPTPSATLWEDPNPFFRKGQKLTWENHMRYGVPRSAGKS
jgi:FkbM family methyltransferase